MPTLFVRLPNHLGDACMCLPALDLLAGAGHALTLAGRPWAPALFEAYRWPVLSLRGNWRERIALLRAARRRDGATGEHSPAILFTNSFSSALEWRLAGFRARGYATDGRRWLLARAVPVPAPWQRGEMHTVEYYDALANTVEGKQRLQSNTSAPRCAAHLMHSAHSAHAACSAQGAPPHRATNEAPGQTPRLALRLTSAARTRAHELLADAGIAGPYTVLCPGVVGVHHGRPKAWDGFPRLCRSLLAAGIRVVAVPGPGERATVEAALPGGRLLNETDVGTFAALLAGAQLVVANDSGPSHVAAAVRAPLVAVFGVTDPARTRPWTHDADLVGGPNGWPDFESVWQRVRERLQLGDAPPAPA